MKNVILILFAIIAGCKSNDPQPNKNNIIPVYRDLKNRSAGELQLCTDCK